MIRPDVLDRFAETFEPAGFDRKAFIPSYGMAEVCLAITFSPHGTGVRTDVIDRAALADRQRAQPAADPRTSGAPGASCCAARCCRAIAWKCATTTGKVLADREVGRIFVAGPSIMPGYFGEPEATREVLSDDGWLDTGDLGYTLDGRGRRHRPRQGPDHRQRPQCLAAGYRMGDRGPQGREERRFGGLLRR